jgi:hypothetical protein
LDDIYYLKRVFEQTVEERSQILVVRTVFESYQNLLIQTVLIPNQ